MRIKFKQRHVLYLVFFACPTVSEVIKQKLEMQNNFWRICVPCNLLGFVSFSLILKAGCFMRDILLREINWNVYISYKISLSPRRVNCVSQLKFKACGQSQNSFWEFKTRGYVGYTLCLCLLAAYCVGGSFNLVLQSAAKPTIWVGGVGHASLWFIWAHCRPQVQRWVHRPLRHAGLSVVNVSCTTVRSVNRLMTVITTGFHKNI
jgi:hypothetical protein